MGMYFLYLLLDEIDLFGLFPLLDDMFFIDPYDMEF
jgi:hypothetical protein